MTGTATLSLIREGDGTPNRWFAETGRTARENIWSRALLELP